LNQDVFIRLAAHGGQPFFCQILNQVPVTSKNGMVLTNFAQKIGQEFIW